MSAIKMDDNSRYSEEWMSAWGVDKGLMVWELKEFHSDGGDGREDKVRSQLFSREGTPYKWYLVLYPFGDTDCRYVSLYLHVLSRDAAELEVSYRMGLLIGSELRNVMRAPKHTFLGGTRAGGSWGFSKFLERYEIFPCRGRTVVDLAVFCEVTVRAAGRSGDAFKECLVEDLGRLLEEPRYWDVVVGTDSGEFQAHKAVLSARSPFFAKTLKEDVSHVKMDLSHRLAREMLTFMYRGEAPRASKMYRELVQLADKFKMPSLKDYCARTMFASLSVTNVPKYLLHASDYGLHELRLKICQFLIKFPLAMETTEYQEFENNHKQLAKEVRRDVIYIAQTVDKTSTSVDAPSA